MPRGDGTGPNGLGPMKGRGAGFCAGNNNPGYMNPTLGRGFMGRGGQGRGRRHCFFATGLTGWQRSVQSNALQPVASEPATLMTRKQELDLLKKQINYHENCFHSLKTRITALENSIGE